MLSAIGTTRHKEYVIPESFLDFGFLLLFAVQFSQNLMTSSKNTIIKVFTSPLSFVVTYEGKINFLLFKKNWVSSQLLQSLCKPEEDKNCNWSHNSLHCEPDFSKSSILVNFLPI